MRVYHTGFQTIKSPDIRFGRTNADFGQGFYLTDNSEFAHRWAKKRKSMETIVNYYDLDTDGLVVHRFGRDQNWFDYIFSNRHGKPDGITADIIIGPIANDTIYDIFGIITSGFLKNEDALKLLQIGPEYRQITLKTEKAASQLHWLSAEIIDQETIAEHRKTVEKEEAEYQQAFAEMLEKITGTDL